MKKLIVISDLAEDSLSAQEIKSAVHGFLKDVETPNINFVESTFSSIHVAFLVEQVVLTEERLGRPHETIILQSTDPRIYTTSPIPDALGAPFLLSKLENGIWVCGPNTQYNFSLIKNRINQVFSYTGIDIGTQFRCRDVYSKLMAYLMDDLDEELTLDEVPVDQIPQLSGYHIGHIDNFGNIKTTIKKSVLHGKFEKGEAVTITINNVIKEVKYVDNLFGGEIGQLVIYPGSSGIVGDAYLEIAIRTNYTIHNPDTGYLAFDKPYPGQIVEIKTNH